MISHISIKDFAIIENAQIDFCPGLNIITGETGAGKSIVIEAVSLALGSRADTAFVRFGKDKAIIQLVAELSSEEYIITREISAAGKNLCRINGELVTLAQVSALCKKIADIHGQYDHQSLLNPEYHIRLVDAYHSDEILPLREDISALYAEYTDAGRELSSLLKGAADNERRRDFMRFELDEIEKASLVPGEDETLAERIALLQNSEKIYMNLAGAYDSIYEGEPAALDSLDRSLRLLSDVSSYTGELSSLSTDFSEVYYRLEDLCHEIRRQRDRITFSPEELDECVARMDLIETMKRKYGSTIEAVLSYQETLSQQLSVMENIDAVKSQLEQKIASLEDQLSSCCGSLTELRKRSASELEEKIQDELKELNFSDSTLSIQFSATPQKFTESGSDAVEFLISTNRGEPLKPLSKIASGGEMSRIMLAFKNIIADYDKIPTMVFDEIDAGISGITASIVGKKMREIAENHQIICITHLPQIAAFGQHNYRIHKESDGEATYTQITPLASEEKVGEIARLLGGINVTETTLESARELIAQSQ